MTSNISPRTGLNETSPLLPKPNTDVHAFAPSNDIVPAETDSHVNNEADGGDIEQQPGNGGTSDYKGLPEMMERMKYIFPATAIGVGNWFFPTSSFELWLTEVSANFPCSSRPNPHRLHIRHNRHRTQRPLFNVMDSNKLLPHAFSLPAFVRQTI